MKIFMLAVAATALSCGAAAAQTPAPVLKLPRADAHFVMGWQHLKKDQPQDIYNDDWLNDIFYGGAGVGWYWTPNHKTQVDIGGGTRAQQYRFEDRFLGGTQTPQSSILTVQQWAVTVEQQYQFFRNQWFHPHVGAGVELARETTSEIYQPIFVYDPVRQVSRVVVPERREGPDHHFLARGVGEVGLKAYMTRQAFFTTDMRVLFRDGIDQVLFRVGFGVDF